MFSIVIKYKHFFLKNQTKSLIFILKLVYFNMSCNNCKDKKRVIPKSRIEVQKTPLVVVVFVIMWCFYSIYGIISFIRDIHHGVFLKFFQ
jgi:hypothetical protein